MITLNTIADAIASLSLSTEQLLQVGMIAACAVSVILLFISAFKISAALRIIGTVWGIVMLGVCGYVAYTHQGVYNLVVAALSVVIFVTLLVALFKRRESKTVASNEPLQEIALAAKGEQQGDVLGGDTDEVGQSADPSCGYYLVTKTENEYGFVLCDGLHNVLLRSYIAFESVNAAMQGIAYCRNGAAGAALQYLSEDGLGRISYPRFAMYRQADGYAFRLDASRNFSLAVSEVIADYDKCEAAVEQARLLAATTDVRVAEE